MDFRPIVGTSEEWALNDRIIPAHEMAVEIRSTGVYAIKEGDGETHFSMLPLKWEGIPYTSQMGFRLNSWENVSMLGMPLIMQESDYETLKDNNMIDPDRIYGIVPDGTLED